MWLNAGECTNFPPSFTFDCESVGNWEGLILLFKEHWYKLEKVVTSRQIVFIK